MNVRIAAALLCCAALGAAPTPIPYGPVPRGPQLAVVRAYVDALHNARYDRAFALLTDAERAYFGDVASYRSVFAADGYVLQRAEVTGARGDDRGRVFFVREQIAYVDHATDERRTIGALVPLGVLPERGTLHVKDPGKPYRAYAADGTNEVDGLRVTVKKLEFFADRVSATVTFTNVGDGFVTLLPYGKSVLRDDAGGVYRIVSSKDWSITDKRLYVGIPLAPLARYTGALSFAAPRLGRAKRTWSLTVAPSLREGGDAPFEVTVAATPRS